MTASQALRLSKDERLAAAIKDYPDSQGEFDLVPYLLSPAQMDEFRAWADNYDQSLDFLS